MRPRSAPVSARTLPSALDTLDEILGIAQARRVALFLDYDGTMTPIVARPDLAVLSEGMRTRVQRLSSAILVGIVSGRDLSDLRSLVGLEGLLYAGSHGFQMVDPSGREEVVAEAEPYRDDLALAADRLERMLAAIPGALVERKRFATAAHYREVAEERKHEVRDRVEDVAADIPRLRVTGGKQVIELRPALEWHKGAALKALVDRHGSSDLFPLYVGDDETDEDAFRALRHEDGGGLHGVGIVVGDVAETYARYRLDDVGEVERWLDALHERLARS